MNNENNNFKKAVRSEIALIILFVVAFVVYLTTSIPRESTEFIFAMVGILGIIPVAKSTVRSFAKKQISVDLLASIALIFSFLGEEWGSMLFINLMLSGARVLDIYTKRRVRTSLESLAKLKPSMARILTDGRTEKVPLERIHVGDTVVVNLGEQIPVDGTILSGTATVNQASLTGESLPVLKEVGDEVFSATVIASGNITMRAERVGSETTFERMIKLIDESSSAKTHMRTLAENFASWYIGIMLLVAIVLYVVTQDTRLVLSVVLVVCADDIAIAVPIAYIAAIGTAARRGIIIKSADFLELASKITTLVVDKTGTLTLGKLAVVRITPFKKVSVRKILEAASSICSGSTHPVSVAIKNYAATLETTPSPLQNFKEVEGRGIVGINPHNDEIVIGRVEFLNERGIQASNEVLDEIEKNSTLGNNVTLLAINGEIIALFSLADEVRAGVGEAISKLKTDGVREVIMLTGDNNGVAKNIAGQLGIEKYYSKLLPEHKVLVLRDYLGKGTRKVAMVGDGVNDAAVISLADLGIAMGGIGSDAAIESSDVVLMEDKFEKIIELRGFSKKVLGVVRGNFIIWGVVNAIGLYFVFIHVFGPAQAAAYNFLTDFIPIANSLRLFRQKVTA